MYFKYLITLLCKVSNLFFKNMSEPLDMVPFSFPNYGGYLGIEANVYLKRCNSKWAVWVQGYNFKSAIFYSN